MDKRGAIEGRIFVYIILLIVAVILILVFLELFTPYKFANLFNSFISGVFGISGGNHA